MKRPAARRIVRRALCSGLAARTTLAALVALASLPLFAGCGDDNKPSNTGDTFMGTRSTPTELLESWLAESYSRQDSARYFEGLDAEFQFKFLDPDAESLRADGFLPPSRDWWGRLADLASSGAMFGSQNVGDVALDIVAEPDGPSAECDGCREVEADVTLSVLIDPLAADPLVWIVNSRQVFVVRKDPSDSTLWVLFRQCDRARSGVRRVALGPSSGPGSTASTEDKSWGAIKAAFARPPAASAFRETPEELFTSWFERAYATKDSARYAEMLAPDFRFTFLPDDAESLGTQGILLPGENSWGRALDLASAGRMFASTNVGDITLDFNVLSNIPDTSDTRYRIVSTQIDLRVVTDPGAIDPLIFLVNSGQNFLVGKDPADPSQWVIVQQLDTGLFRARPGASAQSATAQSSWGKLKGLFAR